MGSLYTQSEIDKLEAIQKFALKLASTHQWDVNCDELLKLTGIPRLSVRRQHLKLAHAGIQDNYLCYNFPRGVVSATASLLQETH